MAFSKATTWFKVVSIVDCLQVVQIFGHQILSIALNSVLGMVFVWMVWISFYYTFCKNLTYLKYRRQKHYKIANAHDNIYPTASGVHIKVYDAPKRNVAITA